MTFQKIAFDILRIAAQHGISKSEIGAFTQPGLEVVVVTLQKELAMWKPVPSLTLRYPAGWWQMFKEQYFPECIKKLLPVKYVEQQFDAVKILPNFPITSDEVIYPDQVDGFIPKLATEPIESPDGDDNGSADQPE